MKLSGVTREQERELIEALQDRAIKWAESHGIGGLSQSGCWDMYQAIDDAVSRECERARLSPAINKAFFARMRLD